MSFYTLADILANTTQVGECKVWNGCKDDRGRGVVRFDGRAQKVHSIVYRLVNGKAPEGGVVRHTCHNNSCCAPRHLIPGTQAQNMADMVEAGRQPKGSNKPTSKLTEEDVKVIKATYIPRDPVYGVRAQARRLGVSAAAVSFVVRGVQWRHV